MVSIFVMLYPVLAVLPTLSRTTIVQEVLLGKVALSPDCRLIPLSKLYSKLCAHPVAATVKITDPLVRVIGALTTSVMRIVHGVKSRLSCTRHLSG